MDLPFLLSFTNDIRVLVSRYRDEGYTGITMAGESSEWRLPLGEFERVRREWQSGAAFLDTTTFVGSRLSLKVARIESVVESTPVTLAARKAMDDETRAENAINGDSSL